MGNAFCRHGATVAQLICNQWVAGSIPVAGTTHFRKPPRHTASVACLFLSNSKFPVFGGVFGRKTGNSDLPKFLV